MKPYLAMLAAIIVLGLIAVDVAPMLKANHEANVLHVEHRKQKQQSEFIRVCKSFYPTSPANQINCIDEMNAERSL